MNDGQRAAHQLGSQGRRFGRLNVLSNFSVQPFVALEIVIADLWIIAHMQGLGS